MATIYRKLNPYAWLGAQATAQGVVPGSAGLVSTSPHAKRLNLEGGELQNRGTGASAVALVGLLADSRWKAYTFTAVGTVLTDDTTDAQDADADDFPLETSTINDGFLIAADLPFSAVSLNVSTAGTGGSQTHDVYYWNGAWVALAADSFLKDIPRTTGQLWASGENIILVHEPIDWAVGGGAYASGGPAGKYCLLVRRTHVAGGVSALCKRAYVGRILFSKDALTANGEYLFPTTSYSRPAPDVEFVGVSSAFSVADPGNNMTLFYSFST